VHAQQPPGQVRVVRGGVVAHGDFAGLAPASHLGKALAHILETYPRDELFQISTDELDEIANGILQLGERQRFRLFIRRDPFERFVSCLIYVPRENYTTELRRRFQSILLKAFDGSSADFDVLLTDAVLARIHMTVRTTPGRIPEYDRRDVERRLKVRMQDLMEDEGTYIALLQDLLAAAAGQIEGADLVVEANTADHKRLAATWASLSEVAAPGRRLTLADEPINTLGGVLVRNTDNTMRVDNTFEGRLDRLRQTVQQVILERLLPSGFDTGNLFTG